MTPPPQLKDLLTGFENAMLVTRRSDGEMRSRPMAIVDVRGDGAIYFATAVDSPKTGELEGDPNVNVVLQSGGRFVSITGTGRIVVDRGLVERLWSEPWKVWFPGGKDDPSLCFVVVEPTEGEFWDRSGGRGLTYLFEAAKAYLGGTQPELAEGEHGKVRA